MKNLIAFGRRRGAHKNAKSKSRNLARKQWRRDHPESAGRKLHCWPLPE